MDLEALKDIIRRYSSLDQMVSVVFWSSNTASLPKTEVRFGTAVSNESFARMACCTANGMDSQLRSRDAKLEGQQVMLLLS